MFNPFPKPGSKGKTRSSLAGADPGTDVNKFGYNPALERRLCYKQSPIVSGGVG
jgi:hypothetical protein